MVGDQHISGGDVSVHEVLRLQVGQGGAQLVGVEDERGQVECSSTGLQELPEFAEFGELHQNEHRRARADADQLNDVLVLELQHDVCLTETVLVFALARLHRHLDLLARLVSIDSSVHLTELPDTNQIDDLHLRPVDFVYLTVRHRIVVFFLHDLSIVLLFVIVGGLLFAFGYHLSTRLVSLFWTKIVIC